MWLANVPAMRWLISFSTSLFLSGVFCLPILPFVQFFLISSSAGKFSGLIPLLSSSPLTSWLFFTCSFVIAFSDFRSPLRIFTLVNSLAKSLALMVIVGKKSASGLLSGMPNLAFMSNVVLPPNSAWSPLLLILENLYYQYHFEK